MTNREEQINAALQDIAKDIKEKLPECVGFALLAYEFGDNPDKRLMYVSNSDREDVCKAMLEFIEKTKANFGKHKNVGNKNWYDLDELLKLPLEENTSIWCLNKHNYSDFLTTIDDLLKLSEKITPEQAKCYQFAIVEKGDKNVK